MVHKSDLSWTVRVNNPADLFHKGDDVEAIILSINHDEKKVSLGIKQLWDDPWPTIQSEFPLSRLFEDADIVSTCDYGVFVRLREGVEGFIPKEELENPEGEYKRGDKIRCEVTSQDLLERRLFLTMRNIGAPRQAPPPQKMPQHPQGPSTLGDLIKEKLGGKLEVKPKE